MIKGIGVDIIEVNRIKNAILRNKNFAYRFFTEEERNHFFIRDEKINFQSAAGNFAAKEAVLKALGTGLRCFKWKDIEIQRDNLGKPHVTLYNKVEKYAVDNHISEMHVTISHCREYAVAYAVALLKEE